MIACGLFGQVVRDRTAALALFMYIPLPLLGPAGVVLDGAMRGRAIPRLRFGLGALGLTATAWSALTLFGTGQSQAASSNDAEVAILQWNVLWGGGRSRSPESWRAQRSAILAKGPDVIILNEAPPDDWLERLVAELGPGGSCVGVYHDPSSPYWYCLAVCSRWPLRLEGKVPLPGGAGMAVTADVRGRRWRLLVVDGISSPRRSRLPFLQAIAVACREAEAAGKPFDAIAGDFNTPSRSIGFDELTALGYRLAGRSAPGWRGTFPAFLPAYDIDHVWLADRRSVGSCAFFNGPYSDHRGQLVRAFVPEKPLP